MTTSDLITPRPLSRQALIDSRQSNPHQALSHQESLALPSALKPRALDLGGPEEAIDLIDGERGTTAASAAPREGVKDALARVALGPGGLILSLDLTRLSRHGSDG